MEGNIRLDSMRRAEQDVQDETRRLQAQASANLVGIRRGNLSTVQRIRERRPQALEWIPEPLPARTIHSYVIALDGRAAAQALGDIAAYPTRRQSARRCRKIDTHCSCVP